HHHHHHENLYFQSSAKQDFAEGVKLWQENAVLWTRLVQAFQSGDQSTVDSLLKQLDANAARVEQLLQRIISETGDELARKGESLFQRNQQLFSQLKTLFSQGDEDTAKAVLEEIQSNLNQIQQIITEAQKRL
uniref:naphthalenediimide binding protein n=1 Tax=Helicana TaxID=456393 RepID=UPI003A9A6708